LNDDLVVVGERSREVIGLVLEIGEVLEELFLVRAGAAEGDCLLIDGLGLVGFVCGGEKLALGDGEGFQVDALWKALFKIGVGLHEGVGFAERSLREEKHVGGVLGEGSAPSEMSAN